MNIAAKGMDVALDGSTLTVSATRWAGRFVLGTDRRTIDVSTLKALSCKLGHGLKGGPLDLVDASGKTVIFFRRTSNDELAALFAELVAIAPDGADQVPTGATPLFKETRKP